MIAGGHVCPALGLREIELVKIECQILIVIFLVIFHRAKYGAYIIVSLPVYRILMVCHFIAEGVEVKIIVFALPVNELFDGLIQLTMSFNKIAVFLGVKTKGNGIINHIFCLLFKIALAVQVFLASADNRFPEDRNEGPLISVMVMQVMEAVFIILIIFQRGRQSFIGIKLAAEALHKLFAEVCAVHIRIMQGTIPCMRQDLPGPVDKGGISALFGPVDKIYRMSIYFNDIIRVFQGGFLGKGFQFIPGAGKCFHNCFTHGGRFLSARV